jgi:hypothetical protein
LYNFFFFKYVDSRRGLGILLFTTAFRTALGPTQPPIECVPRDLSQGVKRPGREADQSPASSAEVKNAWSYTSTPQYVFVAWCLVKHRQLYLYLYVASFNIRVKLADYRNPCQLKCVNNFLYKTSRNVTPTCWEEGELALQS